MFVEKLRFSRVGHFSIPPIETVIVHFVDSVGIVDIMRRLKRSCIVVFVLSRRLTPPLPDSKSKDEDQEEGRRYGSNARTYDSSSADTSGTPWLTSSIC